MKEGGSGGGERDPALEQVKYSSAPRESSRDTNTAETYGAGRRWARRVTLPPWRWGRGSRVVEGEGEGGRGRDKATAQADTVRRWRVCGEEDEEGDGGGEGAGDVWICMREMKHDDTLRC